MRRVFLLACFFLFPAFHTPTAHALPPADSPMVADWCDQDDRTAAPDEAYIHECLKRRDTRLATLKATYPKIVFTKHFNIGGSHYAYTEAQSDAQAERNFIPGSALCLLELGDDGQYHQRTLLSDKNGVIRDPAVTFDGKKIIFAWKKSNRLDDYHLYDYEIETGEVRQLTFGLGYADYEPCPLPNGDILFNSTRCVQIVDCWWTEVSNIYRCDADGNYLRRLSFDQVHTNYPALMDDGRVVYTRWDYNDRGQIFPQGLFQMNPDGTGQTEFYGNNSWFPTTLMHTRGLPGTSGKAVTILSGHHNNQYGKLAIIDTSKGRQENSGVQRIAPVLETTADRIDAWGQWGDRFSYPYPLSEREFIVAYNRQHGANKVEPKEERDRPGDEHSCRTPFGIYWFDADGNRELLAYDPEISCNQPFPLAAREPVSIRDAAPEPEQKFGTYTVQDVYFGPGMEGVARGAAKKLRVIGLDFRSVGIGYNDNHGPSGGAMVSTPISISHGTWDVKIPLGETDVYEDGSACFQAPAHTPLYFQLLDENGHTIQTMRSWSTLQPGEHFSCLGCHEDKNVTLQPNQVGLAMRRGAQPLRHTPGMSMDEHGNPRGFSFAREIQPILDRHCVSCHNDDQQRPPYNKTTVMYGTAGRNNLSPERAAEVVRENLFPITSRWHYTTQAPPENWFQPEFYHEAAKFPLSNGAFGNAPTGAPQTAWETQNIWMWATLELPDDWTTQPLLLQHYHDEDLTVYVNGKRVFAEAGFNVDFSYTALSVNQTAAFRPGTNYLAVHVKDSGGSRGVAMAFHTIAPGTNLFARDNSLTLSNGDGKIAFSLKSTPINDARAKRNWSRSYLNLTNAIGAKPDQEERAYSGRQTPIVNWLNVQDAPSMLPAYKAGAAVSDLMKMFDPNLAMGGKTHNDVQLTREELDKLALWIDLLVPFCGDYAEANAWDETEKGKFAYYETKRGAMQHMSDANAMQLAANHGKASPSADPVAQNAYRDLMREATVTMPTPDNPVMAIDFGKPVRVDQMIFTLCPEATEADGVPACFYNNLNSDDEKRLDGGERLKKTTDPQPNPFTQRVFTKIQFDQFPRDTAGQPLVDIQILGIADTPSDYVAPGSRD